MNFMTDAMTQLRGEVGALRRDRRAFEKGLQQQGRARHTAVEQMCAQFSAARLGMARKTRQERRAFLDNLQGSVSRQRDHMQADLEAARRVWTGAGGKKNAKGGL